MYAYCDPLPQERLVRRLVECAISPQALQSPQQACGALVLLAECKALVQTAVASNVSAFEFVQAMVDVIGALPAHESERGDTPDTKVDVELRTTPVGPDDTQHFETASDFITMGNSAALEALLAEHPHLVRLSDEVEFRAGVWKHHATLTCGRMVVWHRFRVATLCSTARAAEESPTWQACSSGTKASSPRRTR